MRDDSQSYTPKALLILLLGLAPVALAIAIAIIIVGIDRAREVRRHARILSELGAPVSPAAAFGAAKREVVTLEGKLVSLDDEQNKARLVSFHPYGTSFLDEVNVYAITHSSAPKTFAIDLDGDKAGRILLDGPAQVLRGAIETEHTAPLEKATTLDAEPLGRAKVKKRVGQFRLVKPGDRVRARGAIEPAPDDDALYRARSNVLRMTPAPNEAGMGEPKINIAATASRRRRMQSRRALVMALGASAMIGGGLATFAVRMPPPPVPRTAAEPTTKAANQEPPCRAPALAKLARYSTAAGDCPGDDYTSAMKHYAAGDFAAASNSFTTAATKDPNLVPTLTEVEAHLFVHSFDEAASVVRRMNAQFYPGPSTAEKRHLECILEVLEQRAKKPKGGPRFVKICATKAFAKLARQLDSDGQYHGEDDWPRPTFQQETRYDAVNLPYTAVVATRSRLTARPVALERDLVDRLLFNANGEVEQYSFGKIDRYFQYDAPALYTILTTYAAELTLFYAYAGFPALSAKYWPILDRVAELLESNRSFHRVTGMFEGEKKVVEEEHTLLNHVMSIAGAAALYSDDLVRMKRYTGVGEPYSSQASRQMSRVVQASNPWEDPVVDRAWPEHKAVFDAAQAGNAAEVARLLTEQHSTGRPTLPRALARLKDRKPLEAWFHSDKFPQACLTCGASTYLGDLSDRREVARLLGATNERDRLRQAAEHFTIALTDPELGFELDELETFFSKRK